MSSIKHLSLFAGCGGIDLGFNWAGFESIAAVEIKQFACDTLKKNHPGIKVFGPPDYDGDVRRFDADVLKQMVGDTEIDVISGGPPCQPFSVAASQRFYKNDDRYKRKGDQDSEKGNLLPEYIRIINALRPRVFVIENVAALISWNDGKFLTESLKALDSDYVYSKPCAIHAHLFGVPQYRERMIIIGTRVPGKKPMFNDETVSLDRVFTVGDALSDFPETLYYSSPILFDHYAGWNSNAQYDPASFHCLCPFFSRRIILTVQICDIIKLQVYDFVFCIALLEILLSPTAEIYHQG